MITHFAILEWVRYINRGDARGKERKEKWVGEVTLELCYYHELLSKEVSAQTIPKIPKNVIFRAGRKPYMPSQCSSLPHILMRVLQALVNFSLSFNLFRDLAKRKGWTFVSISTQR